MKKTILSVVIGLSSLLNVSASHAEDLLQVYNIAKANDPTVLRAKANADAQQHAIDQATASLLPQLSLNLGYSASERDNVFFTDDGLGQNNTETDSFSRSLTLEQSLFNLANWKSLSIAEKQALQSTTSLEQAKQGLIVRVASAYFDVLARIDDLETVKAEKRAIERQLEQTKQRFEVGLTAITDVHEAQAQFDSAVANEIVSQNAVETAREALREITGKYYNQLNPLNTERFSTVAPANKSATFVEQALEKNLALQVSKASVDIARTQIDQAQAGHYPTLGLSASYSDNLDDISANSSGSVKLPRQDSNSIRLNLSVPLYQGGSVEASRKRAKALFVVASEDLQATHRQVVREVRNAYNQVNANIATYRARKNEVRSAESALKATEAGFEVGTRTIVDVLLSTQNLYRAKRNLSASRYQYIISTLQLKQASGTLNSDDIEAINHGLQ